MNFQTKPRGLARALVGAVFGLSSLATLARAEIERIEYFFGSDPGFANGTEVLVSDPTVPFDLEVPLSLPPGVHRLHVRAQDSDGTWGLTSSIPLLVKAAVDVDPPPVAAVEWFIGPDPGLGGGTDPQPDGDLSQFTADIPATASLPPGVHHVAVRAQDAGGRWGLTSSIPVHIRALEPLPPLSELVYRIEDEDGTLRQTETEIPFASSFIVDPAPFRVYLEPHLVQARVRTWFSLLGPEATVRNFLVMPPDDTWVNAHFTPAEIMDGTASFKRDPDADGEPTGQEYGTLSDPRDSTSVKRPEGWIDGGFLHLSYLQRRGGSGTPGIDYLAAGQVVRPESNRDGTLATWLTGAGHVVAVGSPVIIDADLEEITVRQADPISSTPTGFLRVDYR